MIIFKNKKEKKKKDRDIDLNRTSFYSPEDQCKKKMKYISKSKNETNELMVSKGNTLWANSWIDRWLTWFFGLCLMLSGLGNFVFDCHI